MRLQFQISHLMWLVFGSAMLFGIARVAPAVVVQGYVVFLIWLSATCGFAAGHSFQDLWTESCEDRLIRPRIVVRAKTTACVVIGLAVSLGVLVFGMVILSVMLFFLLGEI